MKLRGQSALEYLVTYGWAILAIVIIAAVLWYTGVFNPSKFRGGNECGGFGSFTCIDQVITTTNTTIVLGNSVGRAITAGSVSIVGAGDEPGTCTADDDIGAGNAVISPNSRVYIECTDPTSLSAESAYEWTISFTYTDQQSGLNKTDAGGFIDRKSVV